MTLLRKISTSVLIVALMASLFTGCKSNEKSQHTGNTTGIDLTEDLWGKVKDSSELPDWPGKKIKLVMWSASGTSDPKRNEVSTNDVVTPEIERVTGVSFDPEKSFDNGGEGAEGKLGKLAAANDYPHVAERLDSQLIDRLAAAGQLYDLSELVPKYCPNIMKQFPLDSGAWGSADQPERNFWYELPTNANKIKVSRMMDTSQLKDKNALKIWGIDESSSLGFFYIRDDILKKIYPEALSKDELENKMMEKGGNFEKEDFFDVSIDSVEEFKDLLYKIKELGLKEDGKEVVPIYTHNGSDNWALMTMFNGALFGYQGEGSTSNNYFSYYDVETKRIEYMFKQDFFKNSLRMWNQFVRDGVASKEAIIDNSSTFKQKLDNGLYAVSYAWNVPSEAVYTKAGKPWRYRKVYVNIPPNYSKFVFPEQRILSGGGVKTVFFKSIPEEDIAQVLKFYDFMASEAGRKLAVWGPKSAGLFTEKEGRRAYVDKELEDCMINMKANGKDKEYNLLNKTWPGYPYCQANPYHPLLTAEEIQLNKSQTGALYNYAFIEPLKTEDICDFFIFNFVNDNIPGVKKLMESRNAFENAMKKVFTASNDAEFEAFYSEFVQVAESIGLTEQTLEEMNAVYKKKSEQYKNMKY